MGAVNLHIEPYPKQVRFFKSRKRYIAYGGARGGGKSWAARTKAVLLALNYPGIQMLLLRRTLQELRENHVIPLQSLLQGIAKYRDQTKEFLFPNGSRIVLGYCAAESDVLQYQGQAYDVMFLEEATQFTEFQFQTLTESNRSSGMMQERFTPRMYFTCNPGGVGHAWVKRLFIDRQYRGAEDADNYEFIPSTVYDNEYLMTNNPEYVENLENLPEMRKKAMLYGDWDAFEGQYFSEWRRDTHVIKPFSLDPSLTRFISIDWGYNDPCAVYWHAVQDGRIYTYRELYVRFTLATEVATTIRNMSAGEAISYVVMSPDAWAKRGHDRGESIAELIEDTWDGWMFLQRADNDRLQGWHRMREYMTTAPDGMPYWVIFEGCDNLIRTLPALVYDEKKVEDVSDKVEDHAPESCRYALMSRPSPRDQEPVLQNAMSHVRQLDDNHLPLALRDEFDPPDWHDL